MTYELRHHGFQSLRMVANAAIQIWRPGVALAAAAAGSTGAAQPGTVDGLIVERPDTTIGANADAVEFYDIADAGQIATSTPVLILRPWGLATQGSYTIPVHRYFVNGIVVRTTDITQAVGMAQTDVTVVFAVRGDAGTGSFVARH